MKKSAGLFGRKIAEQFLCHLCLCFRAGEYDGGIDINSGVNEHNTSGRCRHEDRTDHSIREEFYKTEQ